MKGLPTTNATVLYNEKLATEQQKPQNKKCKTALLALLLVLVPAGLFSLSSGSLTSVATTATATTSAFSKGGNKDRLCQQPSSLTPTSKLYPGLDRLWKSDDFHDQAVSWLSGAVRVETESYDNMDAVGKDPRWKKFEAFHDYLEAAFPLSHGDQDPRVTLTKVNTYGLVYEVKGSDPSLKPLLLTGHQDVVPVEQSTIDTWKYPPYSGHFDGEFIWGRGSVDDKSGLIGILSALESLLSTNFQPRRTIVIASGMDEESSGANGAGKLAPYLSATYGKFALLVDEGGGYTDIMGRVIAAPGTAEKGYGDIRMTVETLGGHSSIPPDHTSIGLLSLLIAELEAHPHPPHLTRENPIYALMTCTAEYAPDLDSKLSKLVRQSVKDDSALKKVGEWLGKDRQLRPFVGTTQAVDLIAGGVKVNALPERASAVINHRINVASSVGELQARIVKVLTPKAKELNLTLVAFGEEPSSLYPSTGRLVLEDAFGNWLEPSPITPTTPETVGWQVLAGTIKGVHASRKGGDELAAAKKDEEDIIVSPSIMSGNTDTRFYWNLTDQIYRYGHLDATKDSYTPTGLHSVNEALRSTAFLQLIRFFGSLILNADEADF